LNSKKPEMQVKIQNVVASVTTGQTLDLDEIVKAFPEAEYKPHVFPGLCLRLKEPKTATLLFKTGKMVCTGARSVSQAKKAVHKVLKELEAKNLFIRCEPEITIQNIVASAILGGRVSLEMAVYSLERIMYEPEQFPGAVYRMDEPKVVILIFSNGKLVVTGAKSEEEAYQAAERLQKKLEERELIHYE